MKILFLGAGYSTARRVAPETCGLYRESGWSIDTKAQVHTLDNNPATEARLPVDLTQFTTSGRWIVDDFSPDVALERDPGGWTLPSDAYDEVHAYEILEHLGAQGDVRAFYRQMNEIWRILRAGGAFCGTVPSPRSIWAHGDPGHSRVLSPAVWTFVDRGRYSPTRPPSSDYRCLCKCDFKSIAVHDDACTHSFCLEAVKPARPFRD